jgi:hypothetical protein
MTGINTGDLEKELTTKEKELGRSHPLVGDLVTQLADLYFIDNKASVAEPLYWRALEICYQQYGAKHVKIATILHSLGEVCEVLSRMPVAEQLYRESLEMRKELLGIEHPEVKNSRANLDQFLVQFNGAEPKKVLEAKKASKPYFLFGNEEFPVTA